jgi:pilin isopeptide linkage protein
LIYNGDTLEIIDVMSSRMSLATHRSNYFVVTDSAGNQLTEATSEKITADQYYITEIDSEEGTAYKIIVPDGKALHIQYLVMVNAAVGETVKISNKAYFEYEGLQPSDTAKEISDNIKISRATGGSGVHGDNPYFQIFKEDQWGNPVEGATFELYKVTLGSDGKEASKSVVATKTTDSNGYVDFADLDEYGVYCYIEKSAPTGYKVDSTPTYFYFTYNDAIKIDGAIGIDYNEKVFDVVNEFSAASLTVPLEKTINGEEQTTKNQFNFTLAVNSTPSGASVYKDQACTSANAVTSIPATVTGCGTIDFDTLYFNTVGTYTFTLSENDLTPAETKEGFSKDTTVYTITVVVDNSSSEGLYVKSATYTGGTKSGDLKSGDIPVFDNTLTLDSVTITLEANKTIVSTGADTGRTIRAGEFTFKVVENGDVIATGKTKAGSTTAEIEFTPITFDQNQVKTHYLTIREDTGKDSTVDYSDVTFFAVVKVEPVEGEAKLQATITYKTQYSYNLKDGKPMFTNTYTPIIVPTGIHLDIVPYAMIAILAAGVGGLMIVRRRKRR